MNPVSTRARTYIHNGIADLAAHARKMRSVTICSESKGIDENIAIVARIKIDLTTDGGYADTIAIFRQCQRQHL